MRPGPALPRALAVLFGLALGATAAAAPAARPGRPLERLVARHQQGVDVRADLVRVLARALPGGRDLGTTALFVRAEPARDHAGYEIQIAEHESLRLGAFWGAAYTRQARFTLRADAPSAPHSRISRLGFDGRSLEVRLTRDREGRGRDGGTTHQTLRLALDGRGAPTALSVSTRGAWWSPFGRRSYRVTLPEGGAPLDLP